MRREQFLSKIAASVLCLSLALSESLTFQVSNFDEEDQRKAMWLRLIKTAHARFRI